MLQISFVGTREQWDVAVGATGSPTRRRFIRNHSSVLAVRPDVVYKWLEMLRRVSDQPAAASTAHPSASQQPTPNDLEGV
jgi:hypothetical protein